MSDTFNKVNTEIPDEINSLILSMKTKAEELEAFFDVIKNREMSLAKTNLEQSIMWATKACVTALKDWKERH